MLNKPLLLYLHGFLSSPQSQKAQQTIKYCQQIGFGNFIKAPRLSGGPAEIIAMINSLLEAQDKGKLMFIGSSLGGFYATYLAEIYQAPAVLINPAVRPFEHWEKYVGEHKSHYSDDFHVVTKSHIDELRNLFIKELTKPDNIMALIQSGDETLDYRLAVEKFKKAHCIVRENGNHSYENYRAELPMIFEFLLSRIGHFER
ncbi:esterase YqiA [Gammaproteobacteria bacterium]|nr:esterase YqiA [Gammaproteobacteria bacterium]